jgi:hypothetical protein
LPTPEIMQELITDCNEDFIKLSKENKGEVMITEV